MWVSPTARYEYDAIRDPSQHLAHEHVTERLLLDHPLDVQERSLEAREQELRRYHGGANDYLILRGVEACGLAVLLTRDDESTPSAHTVLRLGSPIAVLAVDERSAWRW